MKITHAVPHRTKPSQSKGFGCSACEFVTQSDANTMATTPSGTFRKKIQCQEAYVVMKPPTGGPTTGATSPGQVMYAIASIKLCFSVVRNTTSRPTGTIIAPP